MKKNKKNTMKEYILSIPDNVYLDAVEVMRRVEAEFPIQPKQRLSRLARELRPELFCKMCGYDCPCESGLCSACEGLYGVPHVGGLK